MALVRNPCTNGERKDREPAFGEFRLRVFLAREQEHASLVRSNKSNRSSAVSRVSVLPDEPAQSPDGSDDAGSNANRGGRQDSHTRGRGRDRGHSVRAKERALCDAVAVHANWKRGTNSEGSAARFDRNYRQDQDRNETRAFRQPASAVGSRGS